MDNLFLQTMKLYAKGFCCSQIIVMMAMEAEGKKNPDLVRSLGGLCFGVNWSGEVCGALSGGACLISLYSGKGSEGETQDNRCTTMIGDLVEWFTLAAHEEYGGTRCHEILEKYPDRSMCGLIVSETYKKCMDILADHGLQPACHNR